MGFDDRVIDIAYANTKASSAEGILNWLLKGESGYAHSFMAGKNGL